MIVFRTPKGWTGPKFVDGKPVEGTWRAHQVPIADFKNPEHLGQLEDWMKSYRPHELFDEQGKFREEFCRSGADGTPPHGLQSACQRRRIAGATIDAPLPRLRPAGAQARQRQSGSDAGPRLFLRDVMKLNLGKQNFRLFGPDETASNRLEAVYEVSGKEWMADVEPVDINLSADGRVMEVLSENLCEGWLEGYLLTAATACSHATRPLSTSSILCSISNAKWLKVSRTIPWRKPIASLNYLLTSHVWRQDHNGFSHQDPASSIMSRTRNPTSCASIYRPTRTASCP